MRRNTVPEAGQDLEVDPRFAVRVEALLHVRDAAGGEAALPVTLINFSRRGFCALVPYDLAVSEEVALELRGWPALPARVAWSHGFRAGCQLARPLDEPRYAAMIVSADAVDRAGEWNL
jgi:hypothetical protein